VRFVWSLPPSVFNASCAHTPTHIPSSTSHTCQKGWGWEKMQPHCAFQHANQIPISTALALTAPATPSPPMRRQAHSCSGLHFFTRDAKMHVCCKIVFGCGQDWGHCVYPPRPLFLHQIKRGRAGRIPPLWHWQSQAQTNTHTHLGLQQKCHEGCKTESSATPFLHINRWQKGGSYSYLRVQKGSWLASQAQHSRLCSSYAMRPAGQSVAV